MIPVLLIQLGGAPARLKVHGIGTSALPAGVRLAVGAATGLTLVTNSDLDGKQAGAIFLRSVMHSAPVIHVTAAHFGRNVERTAGPVVSTTVLISPACHS